ncbi:ribulose-phosphate 3-epimerase [Streptomyces sp. HC307]|uniref:ribulose-phosphate 3-epimerase n=1 Tax=Streptomyces flavusporus TaxID=3385496 RepID=UPI003916F6C1
MQSFAEPSATWPPTLALPTLSISVVCLDQTRLGEHVEELRGLNVERLHVDVADPAFGGAPGLPLETISDLRHHCDLPIDVHVMLSEPERLLDDIVDRGADAVSVHQRSLTPRLTRMLRRLAENGVETGLAVDPGESIDADSVAAVRPERLTVMTVAPGGAGRPFREEALATVHDAALLKKQGVIHRVEVDGAVGPATAPRMLNAGADQLVLGSSAFPHRSARDHRLAELRLSLESLLTTTSR